MIRLLSNNTNALSCLYVSKKCTLTNFLSPRIQSPQEKWLQTSATEYTKIYTKTGDKGKSSTFAGDRRAKNDTIFEALGAVDELTSAIGIARQFTSSNELSDQLYKVQCILQDLASCVATPKSHARAIHLDRTKFEETHVSRLEEWIDDHTKELPELKNFIIPSGGKASSHLHMARAICRRAERRVLPVVANNEVDKIVIVYLNRLSDYLFTAARVAATKGGKDESIYVKPS